MRAWMGLLVVLVLLFVGFVLFAGWLSARPKRARSKPRKRELYPNEFKSFWELLADWARVPGGFLHSALHPRLTEPKTLKKYLHVLGVYHRCMKAFKSNHELMRKNLGHADPSAFGMQHWQEKHDLSYDPNWEVKVSMEEDSKAAAHPPNDFDDRADSDPPKKAST